MGISGGILKENNNRGKMIETNRVYRYQREFLQTVRTPWKPAECSSVNHATYANRGTRFRHIYLFGY